ncbi:hypothetical protein GCM10023350_09410 [Nocardioides endophyticus]|uniref:Uncharacterized protein n=1 Tax=Nocardioides endophyticus TaxID=1353775 RepID=A0ABP8YHS7_9ACTN
MAAPDLQVMRNVGDAAVGLDEIENLRARHQASIQSRSFLCQLQTVFVEWKLACRDLASRTVWDVVVITEMHSLGPMLVLLAGRQDIRRLVVRPAN